MADYTKYTKQEMQAYAIAKNIKGESDRHRGHRPSSDRRLSGQAGGLPLLPPPSWRAA